MKKFEKVMLAAFILLVVYLSITTCMITPTPKANVTKIPTTEKITLNNISPIKNRDGSLTYNNVKPNVFNSMKQKFAEAGVQIPQGNEGDIEMYGTEIHFKWDNATNLTIMIKNKPLYISNETIIGKITEFVHNCGGS